MDNPMYYETMSVVNKVNTTNNIVGNINPDSLGYLPFGIVKEIGSTRYIIAIDSAVYLPRTALCSAYMALEFPGSLQKLAFAGKNIPFNPKGVIPGANTRLMLACDQSIDIGPNIKLTLKADGTNYVEWDCNGFKAVRMKGYFEFSSSMIVPDPSSKDSTVTAAFDIYTNDIHNFITQISITPFTIKGLNDVSFTVSDAVVDMSEIANAPAMTFPQGYPISSIGPNVNIWTGFYLKQLKIKLPKELSKSNSPTELYVNNFFIDKSGVTGNFQAANLFSVSEGTMNGWGFSVDQLGLNFISNKLNAGNLAGSVLLPLNNTKGVACTAAVYQNSQTEQTDYSFSIAPVSDYTATVLSAKLDLYPTSKIMVQKKNGTFLPSALLNGKITFSHADLKSPALEMEQVLVTTDAPYIKNGIFSFAGGDTASARLGNFEVSLNSINILANGNTPGIGFNAGINFTSREDNAFGSAVTFNVLTTVIPNVNKDYAPKLFFDRIDVKDILLDIRTCAFKFDGLIKFINNNPTYGKGFFGNLNLSIPGIMPTPASANVWFGTKNTLNYYYFDLAVPYTQVLIEPSAECPEGLALYRFMGGLYYHMRPATVNQVTQLYSNAFGSAQLYIPDSTNTTGLKGGVTLGTYPNNRMLNGDVAMEVNFTNAGGINTVKLAGTAFMFIKIEDRVPVAKANPPVKVGLTATYDFQNSILHTLMNADINMLSVKAHGQAEFHVDPKTWYINFGTPQNRVNIDMYNIASLSSYIMAGNEVDAIPPPPQQVASAFGHGFADSRDKIKTAGGKGCILGSSLQSEFNGEFGLNDFSVYYNLSYLAGFDLMAYDYGTTLHCSGSSSPAGLNGWYAQGDVYAYLSGTIGAKGALAGDNFDVKLVSLSAAALLGGKFPNPGYLKGDVNVSYNFLRTFKGSFTCHFESGSECTLLH